MKVHPADAEAEREKRRQRQKAYRDRLREKAREEACVTEQGRHPGDSDFKMDSGGEASSPAPDVCPLGRPAPVAVAVVTRSVEASPDGTSRGSSSSSSCSVCGVQGQIRWIITTRMGMRHVDRERIAGEDDP